MASSTRTRDPAVIRDSYSGSGRSRNIIGVATGQPSGVLVVDLDIKGDDDGRRSFWSWLASLGLEWPPDIPYVATPSGGVHLWLRLPAGRTVQSRNGVLPSVDIKGDGGYVVVPPSGVAVPTLRRPGEPKQGPVFLPYTWHGCPCEAPEAPSALLDALDGLHGTGNGGSGGHAASSLPKLPPTAHLLEHGFGHPHDFNLARLAARLAAEGKAEAEAFGIWQEVVSRHRAGPRVAVHPCRFRPALEGRAAEAVRGGARAGRRSGGMG